LLNPKTDILRKPRVGFSDLGCMFLMNVLPSEKNHWRLFAPSTKRKAMGSVKFRTKSPLITYAG